MTRILFLAPPAKTPSTRYRVNELVPVLERNGIDAAVRYHTKSGLDPFRMRWSWKPESYDAVVVHRRLFSPRNLRLLRERARRLVFDFDDAIHLGRKGGDRRERKQEWFSAMVSCADLVIAGNETLREAALESGAKRVEILPTALPTSEYSTTRESDGATLGWLGSRDNLRYLREILPSLETVAESNPGMKLRIISNDFLRSDRLTIEEIPWSREGEIAALEGVDIGLGPLADDPWTRGKCGFKLLQYMAAAIPVIASPVAVQREIVEEGKTGLLPANSDEWVAAVRSLLDDSSKRSTMGKAGRVRVVERYDSGIIGERLARLLRNPGTGEKKA